MEQQTIKTPKNTAALQPKAAGAVAKKKGSSVVEYLNDAKFQAQIAAALPKFLDTEHFVRSALTEFRLNPALAECSVPSVLGYFMQAAACGLNLESRLGLCYPVPFKNKKTGQTECTFLLSYRGMMEIARRSGKIARFETNIVHENDEIILEYGLDQKFKFSPVLKGDAGKMIGAYVQVDFVDPNTKPMVMYMTKEEIDKHRKRSKAASSGPWVTDYEAMAKKTLVRAIFKMLPASIEQVMGETGDGAGAKYTANAVNDDDLVEIEFVDSRNFDDAEPDEETAQDVDEAVDKMAEQMGMKV